MTLYVSDYNPPYASGYKQPLIFQYGDKNEELTLDKIVNDNRIDILDKIYENNYDIKNFANTIISSSITNSNFETFKWLFQKVPDYKLRNEDVNSIFYTNNYQEFIEYVIDNVYYEYIDLNKISNLNGSIQYCINNMHKLKLKYTSRMIYRLTQFDSPYDKDNKCYREVLDCILQASLDGRLDYSIWSDTEIFDKAGYHNLQWLYDKYKLNLIPFNYTINAIHNARYDIEKIKWWLNKQDEFSIECNISLEEIPLEIFKYLYEGEHVIKIKLDTDAFESLLANDQFDILEYLFDKKNNLELIHFCNEIDYDYFSNYEGLVWLYSKYKLGLISFKYTHNTFDNAVTNNYFKIVQWFIDNCIQNGGELELLQTVDSDDFDFIYVDSRVMQYLLNKQDIIKINISRVIETTTSEHILSNLYKKYIEKFDITTVSNAIDNCKIKSVLEWWFDHSIENGGMIHLNYSELSIDNLFKNDDGDRGLRLLKLWYDNRFKFTPKFTKEYLISYVNEDYENRKCYLDLII
jgi:hypothetical protein